MSTPTTTTQPPTFTPRPTNTMAILSLVFAFLFWPLSIVFGHMARKQIKTSGENGRGLATAGLVISYLGLGVFLLVVIGGVASVNRESTPAPPFSYSQDAAPAAEAAPPMASTGPVTSFGDGTYAVGTDVQPGTYHTTGTNGDNPVGCYWAKSSDTSGNLSSVTANNISKGPQTVTISASGGAFASQGCNTWTKTS